ncbi:hypothetical protein LOTGIDRAFT_162343 [Lottia gigantea]|uniref:Sushi domain-containing protein n=1 Tax=Lottia gigantea TaxID=225164 RepID=V4AHK9_LOTGI|nr:hypothetical protein LOTGIDRAFT_162343 [Lottia gigantea]ESO92866.1 hypothetical protein LOTGIDRAFT_162343 [Lottia gigantea]
MVAVSAREDRVGLCVESPPQVPDGIVTNTDRFVGDVAIYSCVNDTVLMNGPGHVECQSNQTWPSPTFDCRRQCPVPPSLDNGEGIAGPRTLGETITYLCNDLFVMEGTPEIFCMSNQTWTQITFYCRPICPDPPVVADSSILSFNNSINGTAEYQCDIETVLMGGPPVLTCLSSQTWSTIQFECRRQCAVPDAIPNTYNITIPARTIGTILNYTCIDKHDVYPLTETPQSTCQQNQQWLIPFQCKPVLMIIIFASSPSLFTVCVESPPQVPDGIVTNTDRFVGDVAIYSCVNDTVLMNGPGHVECQSNQTWSLPNFECRRQCPVPPSLDNGESIAGPRTLGETITYLCNDLFVMEGTPEIFCMSNQTWTQITFYCRPICPDPPVVADSSILSFNNSINGTGEYQCDIETVLMGGPPVLTCLSSQTWSTIQFECRRQCAVPDAIPNTYNITIPARTIGTILNYTCIDEHDVYPLTETPQSTCQQNQQWLIPFQCKPVCVESPPTIPNGIVTNTDRFVGDVAIYSCVNDTVLMNGPGHVECQSNQTWSSPTFDCRRQCPMPPTLDNGESIAGPRTLGETITYLCNDLFVMEGTPEIFCMSNQTWTQITFYCRPICPDPPVVADSSILSFNNSINGTAEYQCDIETVLMGGPPVLTCLSAQNWSLPQFECRRLCEEAPSLPDANLTNTDRFVGDVAIYSCVNDTVLMNGPAHVECQSNQTWSSPTFDCRRQCPEPPTVENTESVTTDLTIGTIYNYTCITGHQPTSISQIVCQNNQQWSTVQFECRPVCEDAPNLPDANLTNTDRFVGDVAIYSCVNDTVLMNGPAHVECQSNQTWSSPTFDCRRQCPEPPTVNYTDPVTGPRVIGSILTYTCTTGYGATSNSSITCQQDGHWSLVLFECHSVCEVPPTVQNTTVFYNDTFVGSNATFECDSSLMLSGNPTITCQVNTTWSSVEFSCN